MPETHAAPIYLKDYTLPSHLIHTIDLVFDLDPKRTRVTATSRFIRNPAVRGQDKTVVLDGENLTFIGVEINGTEVNDSEFILTETSLTLFNLPEEFELTVYTELDPESNKALEGLYLSGGRFCTQCEAEGFRRITYCLDRPDVLAAFNVKIIADSDLYPVLLSNGNCAEQGSMGGSRHYAVWSDPFPKPCYLFALVAGQLGCLSNSFTTASNKTVALNIYVEPGKEEQARYAMDALKRAMGWDERVYGLEYDLNEFNIVAVSDFNMGAMENKSLNIFNDKFILADPETATDTDYAGIESVVAHEYFHNWTGNRVTCRDWFQLSLKEGLTVFRDQQFSADERSHSVQRVEDVKRLITTQFVEDAGPLAHSVRPDSYAEINNFYTHTVYEKGAEVVRMIYTLIGKDNFRSGMDLYFKRHDGTAVTCDEFVAAMSDASDYDLDQFLLWYKQAGTPSVEASGTYQAELKQYSLTLKQSCPDTPGQNHKKPMHIPLAVGFVDKELGSLATKCADLDSVPQETHLVVLRTRETTLTFYGFPESTSSLALSINRGFTSPILSHQETSLSQLAALMVHDPDSVSRWQASQELTSRTIIKQVRELEVKSDLAVVEEAFEKLLSNSIADPETATFLLTLPSETVLAQLDTPVDPVAIHKARQWLMHRLGNTFFDQFSRLYEECKIDGPFSPSAHDTGLRSLKNSALDYMVCSGVDTGLRLAFTQFQSASNMTDRLAALSSLNKTSSSFRREALDTFAKQYSNNELVLDKWLTLEASYFGTGTLARIKCLLDHPKYNDKNPNRIRALIGTFALSNYVGFHNETGSGYEFIADQIIQINKFNPQSSARIAGAFQHWKRYGPERRNLMLTQLQRIQSCDGLSEDVAEIVNRTIGQQDL
ncbi:MAG: aminopeptidase N [Rhodospirillaceae bacterium]|nr:aminopeptidase N [Rhodospirillaceae bacterium]